MLEPASKMQKIGEGVQIYDLGLEAVFHLWLSLRLTLMSSRCPPWFLRLGDTNSF